MASKYLACRHCVYCNDNLRDTMCTIHKKMINPGVACCEDIVYTPKGLARVGKRQRVKMDQAVQVSKSRTKNNT